MYGGPIGIVYGGISDDGLDHDAHRRAATI